jgi:hypothetical protein
MSFMICRTRPEGVLQIIASGFKSRLPIADASRILPLLVQVHIAIWRFHAIFDMAPYIDDMSSPRIATVRELTPGPTAGGEQLDDLFDYDVDLDDVFRPLSPLKPIEPAAEKKALGRGQNGLGLGIDEEVEVTKKQRAPRVKLDENRCSKLSFTVSQ